MPFRKDRFAELTKNAGYSQRKLATLLGVSNQTVSNWEKGVINPTIEHLDKIHDIFIEENQPNVVLYEPA